MGMEGHLRMVFTAQSVTTRKSGSQRSGYKGAHVGRPERRRKWRPQCDAEEGSAGSDSKSLRSSPFLTFVPEIYPLSHKQPLGVQDRILQIFVPQEEAASWFLGLANKEWEAGGEGREGHSQSIRVRKPWAVGKLGVCLQR